MVEAIKRRKINEAAEEKKLFKIYLMGSLCVNFSSLTATQRDSIVL